MIKALINTFAENTYIIKDGKEAVIIDPGAPVELIKEFIDEQQIVVKAVLLTHGHIDHILSLNHVLDEYKDVFVYIHENERDFLFDPNLNLSSTTYNRLVLNDKSRVKTFKDGDVFKLKYQDIEITHNPGHTRGSSSFKYKNSLFCGDTIFDNGVGRTDLPTGNSADLERSINKLLNKYRDNTLLRPGHGQHTTILTVKHENMYYKKKK